MASSLPSSVAGALTQATDRTPFTVSFTVLSAGYTRDSTMLSTVMADDPRRLAIGKIALVADQDLVTEKHLRRSELDVPATTAEVRSGRPGPQV